MRTQNIRVCPAWMGDIQRRWLFHQTHLIQVKYAFYWFEVTAAAAAVTPTTADEQRDDQIITIEKLTRLTYTNAEFRLHLFKIKIINSCASFKAYSYRSYKIHQEVGRTEWKEHGKPSHSASERTKDRVSERKRKIWNRNQPRKIYKHNCIFTRHFGT